MFNTHEVFLRGIMEAPHTDVDKLKLSIKPAQSELDTARAQYAADYDMARARSAGAKARQIAENDALNRIQPDQSKEAKVQ